MFDKALGFQFDLFVVVGDEVTTAVFLTDVADDGDFVFGFHLFVILLADGEEQFVVFAAVEGDSGGDDFQLAQGVEGELCERDFAFINGAAEGVGHAEME